LTLKVKILQASETLNFRRISHLNNDLLTPYCFQQTIRTAKMPNDQKTVISAQDLAHLGGGVFAYVRKIEAAAAAKLLGDQLTILPNTEFYCLYNANGLPISISANYQAAIGSAEQHELIAASVH
jgi:hypothetical protein